MFIFQNISMISADIAHWSTVTGPLITSAHSSRVLYKIYAAVIGQLWIPARNYSCAFVVGRCLFNRTLHFTSVSQISQRPLCSVEYGRSFQLKSGHSRLVDKGRSFHKLSSEVGSSPETEQSTESSSSSHKNNMEPYFEATYAKLGTSSCKKCKEKIEKGSLRLAKVRYMYF